jgi:anaerobic magnesium-protoporphyrin IX monomethyl ester cyclase
MIRCDVLVLSAFRKPVFRGALNPRYPIEEPWDSAPLVIAAAIESSGMSCSYLPLQNLYPSFDIERDFASLKQLLAEHRSRVVLFSSCNFVASRSTAAIYGIGIVSNILKSSHDPVVGVTGRLATTAASYLMRHVSEIDFITLGEIEGEIGEIVQQILKHGLDQLAHLSVISRKQFAKRADIPPIYAEVPDLNLLPVPAFHLARPAVRWFHESGRFPQETSIPFSIRTSAGCKFSCKFCAGVPFWRNYRTKDVATIEREIVAFTREIGIAGRISFFEDEIFTLNEEHVSTVANLLVLNGIRLDGVYTHAAMLSEGVAASLLRMTKSVCLGFDSADDRVLRSMGKGQTLDLLFRAIKNASNVGLPVHLEWIIGAPPEDLNSLVLSLASISQLLFTGAVESIQTYVFCPHPGTEFGMHCNASYEEIQESGGFPQYEHSQLTKNQVFTAYLMSQLIIAEVRLARHQYGAALPFSASITSSLKQIFEMIDRR